MTRKPLIYKVLYRFINLKLSKSRALVVFLIIFIVQLAVNLVSGVEDSVNSEGTTVSDIWSCSKKFINGVDTNDETEE